MEINPQQSTPFSQVAEKCEKWSKVRCLSSQIRPEGGGRNRKGAIFFPSYALIFLQKNSRACFFRVKMFKMPNYKNEWLSSLCVAYCGRWKARDENIFSCGRGLPKNSCCQHFTTVTVYKNIFPKIAAANNPTFLYSILTNVQIYKYTNTNIHKYKNISKYIQLRTAPSQK